MMKKRLRKRRTGIIALAVFLSILLYFLGVLSGLYANKAVKKETQEGLLFMKNYIDLLELNLKTVQLEESFVKTLNKEELCRFSTIAMDGMLDQLREFWNKLPFRIEAYERNRKLSEDYLNLKKQYIDLSLRAWLVARDKYEQCDTDFIPVLYFYSRDCEVCIEQGRALDNLKGRMREKGKELLVFTVDIDADERFLDYLKKYYGIKGAPAIIFGNTVRQGRLFSEEEMLQLIARG